MNRRGWSEFASDSRTRTAAGATIVALAALLAACDAPRAVGSDDGAAPDAGRILVDADNPAWFVRSDGSPVYLCGPGDPEGFFYRGKREPDGTRRGDQQELIARLAGTGANTIYLMAVRSHGGDGDATQNPFVNSDPAAGLSEAILNQWGGWLDALDAAGVAIFFIFYDDGTQIWDTGERLGETESDFVRALVDRFEHHQNLIWCVAEEYSEGVPRERVSRIAAEIRAADDYDHAIAVHQRIGVDFDFPEDPHIDQFAIQADAGDRTALHADVLTAWSRAGGRYQLLMAEAADFGTGRESRRKMWACALAGAYVMVYEMDVVSTDRADLEDCGRLVRFMESTSFRRMAPRDDLAFAGTEWVLADPGREYIAYSASGAPALGLRSLPAGDWSLRWFDCATGEEVRSEDRVDVPGEDRAWTKPSDLGDEIALSVELVR